MQQAAGPLRLYFITMQQATSPLRLYFITMQQAASPLRLYFDHHAAGCILHRWNDVGVFWHTYLIVNTYAKISLLASFHAGCDRNRSVESPEACHRIGTRRGGRSIGNPTTVVTE